MIPNATPPITSRTKMVPTTPGETTPAAATARRAVNTTTPTPSFRRLSLVKLMCSAFGTRCSTRCAGGDERAAAVGEQPARDHDQGRRDLPEHPEGRLGEGA